MSTRSACMRGWQDHLALGHKQRTLRTLGPPQEVLEAPEYVMPPWNGALSIQYKQRRKLNFVAVEARLWSRAVARGNERVPPVRRRGEHSGPGLAPPTIIVGNWRTPVRIWRRPRSTGKRLY